MLPITPQPHFPSPYLRPLAAPAAARMVEAAGGARIAAFVYGELSAGSIPVLMLHGNGEEHGIFGPVIEACLERGLIVIAPDSRGQGKSERGSAPLSYELMTDDAIAVLDAFDVRCAHVLGFSDGGIEALLMARDHPERTASITALGANLTPEGVIDDDWDIEGQVEVLSAWANCDWPDKVDTALLSPAPDEARIQAELLQLMLDEPHIDAASLEAISCPATIVAGEFDAIRDHETVAIARAIHQARLVIVPGEGHSLPKHAPELVARILLDTVGRA